MIKIKKTHLKSIYNLIKEEITLHPKVKNSVLENSKPWKRSHYIILSEIIRQELSHNEELQNERKFELGNTISHITLQRFFENDYQDKTHNDLRFLKTLDKICIFLGFKDLNSYVASIKENKKYDETGFSEKESTELVYQYCLINFEFFKLFPVLNIHVFDDLIFPDAPFIERIRKFSAELCERNLKLVTKNNRSNFEIFDISLIADEEDKKVLKTQEFWNLNFVVEETNQEFIVNELNTQIYFLKKIDGKWKIWDNYNPNSGLLNKK